MAKTGRKNLAKEERHEQILQSALRAFMRGGYHGTHVEHIVAEAGVARGTFYLHFKSKHDVFAALVDRTLEVFLQARPEGEEPAIETVADAEDLLRRSYTVVLTTLHEHRQLMRLLFDEAVGLGKGFRAKLDEHYRAWHQRIRETIRYFHEREVVREHDAEVTAELVIGMVERLARRYLFTTPEPDIPRLVEALVSLEMNGLRAR